MARLTQNREIDLSTGNTSVVLSDLIEVYYLYGTAVGNVVISPSGTAQEGMTVIFKFHGSANMDGNTLTIFGDNVTYTDDTEYIATVTYHNAFWRIDVLPDFEEPDIVGTLQIQDDAITAAKFNPTLNLAGKTITNVNIDSGSIDGVGIGGSGAGAAEFTTCLIDDVTIDSGQINDATIGASTPSTIAATTISSSGGITGDVVGDVTGDLKGKADTADALDSSVTIAGVAFDGSANIDLTVEGLNGTTLTTAEANLLAGTAAAGVTAADMQTIKDIDTIFTADKTTMTIGASKSLDVSAGGLIENTRLDSVGGAIQADDCFVYVTSLSPVTVTALNAGSYAGRQFHITNLSTFVTTLASAGGLFQVNHLTNTFSTLKMAPGATISIVSTGTQWLVTSNYNGAYIDAISSATQGTKKIKIIKSTQFKPLLDTVTNNVVDFNAGDIITNVRVHTSVASAGAGTIAIGLDAALTGAGAANLGLMQKADAAALGAYEAYTLAGTYAGTNNLGGFFTCVAKGSVTVTSTVDQTASTFTGNLIIEYIEA